MEATIPKLDGYLREHTTLIHKRTEKVLEPLELFTNLTLSNYSMFVYIQYRWHLELEQILATANPAFVFDGYQYNPKIDLLRKDLEAFGIKAEPDFVKKMELDIPGIIYVLEGSMLGGTVISKHLEDGGIEPQYRHYFSHCKESAKNVWPLTKKYLQSIENSSNKFDASLETSAICFERMIDIAQEEISKKSLS